MYCWTSIKKKLPQLSFKQVIKIYGYFGLNQLTEADDVVSYHTSKWKIIYSIFVIIILFPVFYVRMQYVNFINDATMTAVTAFWKFLDCSVVFVFMICGLHQRKIKEATTNSVISCAGSLALLTKQPVHLLASNYVTSYIIACLLYVVTDHQPWNIELNRLFHLEYIFLLFRILISIEFATQISTIEQLLLSMINGVSFDMLCESSETIKIDGTVKAECHVAIISEKEIRSKLKEYKKIYHRIYITSKHMMAYYQFSCLILLLYMTAILSISGFHLLYNIIHATRYFNKWVLVSTRVTTFLFITICYAIVPCSKSSKKGLKLLRIINRYRAFSQNEEISKELHKFSMLLQIERIEFAPFGLLQMNNQLIVGITGAAVTYVVILSQMQDT